MGVLGPQHPPGTHLRHLIRASLQIDRQILNQQIDRGQLPHDTSQMIPWHRSATGKQNRLDPAQPFSQ